MRAGGGAWPLQGMRRGVLGFTLGLQRCAAQAGPALGRPPARTGRTSRRGRHLGLAPLVTLLVGALGLAHVAAFTCAPGNDAVPCASLSDLYSATGGGSWWQTAGWANASANVPTDYCTFYGVSCSGGAVILLCVRVAFTVCCVWPRGQ